MAWLGRVSRGPALFRAPSFKRFERAFRLAASEAACHPRWCRSLRAPGILLFCPCCFFVSETHHGVRTPFSSHAPATHRSFDHLMGFLKRVNPEIQGLVGNETNPYDPKNLSLGYVTVSDDSGYVTEPDPGVRPRRGGVR